MKQKNKTIIEALKANGGNITSSAIALVISRRTLYRWIKDDDELLEAVNSERESLIDLAENSLLTLVKNLNAPSVFYVLNNLGRSRGYGYNHKIEIEQKPSISKEDLLESLKKRINEGVSL